MGKIIVIKNYALPKLVYGHSSLPDPTKHTIKQIKTIMYKWDSKPARIKKNVLRPTIDYEKEEPHVQFWQKAS